MSRKSGSSVIMSVVSLMLSIVFAVSLIFAWFASNIAPKMSGVNTKVVDAEHNGYTIITINNSPIGDDDGFMIYPRDVHMLGAMAANDTNDFGIRIDVEPLEDFFGFFKLREDLINGLYQKEELVTDAEENSIAVPIDYNIDDILENTSLNDLGKIQQKMNFLKKFTDSNSILSALTLKIVAMDNINTGELVEIEGGIELELITSPQPGKTTGYFFANEDDEKLSMLEMYKGQNFLFEISYGANEYLPTMSYKPGDSAYFAGSTYYALNYNCFIGQSITISFENNRGG